MSKIPACLLFLSLLSPLTFGQQQSKITTTEYAIYAVVLRGIYRENRRDYSNDSHFVFVDRTLKSEHFSSPAEKRYRRLVKRFENLNRYHAVLERKFPKGEYSKTYYLISQAELDELFREGQRECEKRKEEESRNQKIVVDICVSATWQPFYRKYPEASGYYELSRVAVSQNLAMVGVKREDVRGGFDLTYILQKTRKGWRVIWSAGSHWVS